MQMQRQKQSMLAIMGEYLLLKRLGQGSYSDVFLCQRIDTGEAYAAKTIKRSLMDDNQERAYNNEVEQLKKLDHPNVVKVIENMDSITFCFDGSYNSVHCIIQELGQNGSLKEHIEKKIDGFDEACARRIFKQLIETLDFMHKQGVVHRDVKDDNLVLDENFDIKLIDFTFSASADEILDVCCGTLFYQAPEILANEKYTGKPCDVFASAVTLFRLLTNNYPFYKASRFDFRFQHVVKQQEEKFWELQHQEVGDKILCLSPEVKDLMFKMMNADPERRMRIEEILDHPWMKQPCAEDKAYLAAFDIEQEDLELDLGEILTP